MPTVQESIISFRLLKLRVSFQEAQKVGVLESRDGFQEVQEIGLKGIESYKQVKEKSL